MRVGSAGDLTSGDALGLFWPGLALWPSCSSSPHVENGHRGPIWSFLAGGVIGFHVVTPGIGRATGLNPWQRGWLLGPFPEGALWPGPAFNALAGADWGAIAGEAAGLITILLIVPITLLLYIGALEVETKSDVDMNAELRATGWANVAAGAVGGPPGYMYLADTLITQRLVGRRRGPAVVAAFGILGVLVVGGAVLEFVPEFVIGGLLLFVGSRLHGRVAVGSRAGG